MTKRKRGEAPAPTANATVNSNRILPSELGWSAEQSLIALAQLIEKRVDRWNYPSAIETDDERQDHDDLWDALYSFVFERPLSLDLEQVDYERILIWLNLNAPAIVDDVRKKVDALAEALGRSRKNQADLIVHMGKTAWMLKCVASELQNTSRQPADGNRQSQQTTKPAKKKHGGQQRYDAEDDRRKNDQVDAMMRQGASLKDAARQLGMTVPKLTRLRDRVRFRRQKHK